MWGIDRVADELQGVIGFHRTADVGFAAFVQRPAAVVLLVRPQVTSELSFQNGIDFVHEMHHQDIFGGDRAVCFQLVEEMSIGLLIPGNGIPRPFHGRVERVDCLDN